MQVLAEGIPIVGHGVAAGYAIAGDTEKAEEVALGIKTRACIMPEYQ